MTTGTVLIQEALEQIGAHSIAAPADAAAIERGKDRLNSMCELWLTRNIDFGFTPLSVAGDDLDEPSDVRNVIIDNLAVQLAPKFEPDAAIVSRELRASARTGFEFIKTAYEVITISDKVVSSTLPLGAGNHRHGFGEQQKFHAKGAKIDG